MRFGIAAVAVLFAFVLFLIAAALSCVTSSGDGSVWGWRVFKKLGILKLLRFIEDTQLRRREAKRRKRNQN